MTKLLEGKINALIKKSKDENKITEFDMKVYEVICNIPKGKVTTYKSVAKAIGKPKAFRAVGTSLSKNPFAPEVPCHRVIASDYTLGGFYGSKDPKSENIKKKIKILQDEGVSFEESLNKGNIAKISFQSLMEL